MATHEYPLLQVTIALDDDEHPEIPGVVWDNFPTTDSEENRKLHDEMTDECVHASWGHVIFPTKKIQPNENLPAGEYSGQSWIYEGETIRWCDGHQAWEQTTGEATKQALSTLLVALHWRIAHTQAIIDRALAMYDDDTVDELLVAELISDAADSADRSKQDSTHAIHRLPESVVDHLAKRKFESLGFSGIGMVIDPDSGQAVPMPINLSAEDELEALLSGALEPQELPDQIKRALGLDEDDDE